jgi:hypothetical protein
MYGDKFGYRTEDIDHIHPRSIINPIYPNDTNQIENYQLLDSDTNRNVKRAKPFKEWFCESVEDKLKDEYLKRHFIPTDTKLWEITAYMDFITERRKLIVAHINSILN